MTENEKLRALLVEARDALQGVAEYDTDPDKSWTLTKAACREAQESIDAALAEPPAECPTCAVSKAFHDVAIAEKRMAEFQLNAARAALADAYKRGAEAMKRAAVAACDDEAVSHRQIGRMTDEYRAFGAYLAAARVETLPIPEDKP
jgi:hypothetical protein